MRVEQRYCFSVFLSIHNSQLSILHCNTKSPWCVWIWKSCLSWSTCSNHWSHTVANSERWGRLKSEISKQVEREQCRNSKEEQKFLWFMSARCGRQRDVGWDHDEAPHASNRQIWACTRQHPNHDQKQFQRTPEQVSTVEAAAFGGKFGIFIHDWQTPFSASRENSKRW